MESNGWDNFHEQPLAHRAVAGLSVHLRDYSLAVPATELQISGIHAGPVLSLWQGHPGDPQDIWVCYGGTDYPLFRGLSYVPSHTPWCASLTARAGRVLECHFEPEHLKILWGSAGDGDARDTDLREAIGSVSTRVLMAQIAEETQVPGFGQNIVLESLSHRLVEELGRRLAPRQRTPTSAIRRLSHYQLRRIRTLVEETEGRALTTQCIADRCQLNPDYLRRAFRGTTRQTLASYVEEVRLARAKHFLEDNRIMIKQIAHRLGFSSPSAFSVAFRRATGMSPGDYRAKVCSWESRLSTASEE